MGVRCLIELMAPGELIIYHKLKIIPFRLTIWMILDSKIPFESRQKYSAALDNLLKVNLSAKGVMAAYSS